jgi:hypothetical protein
MKRDTTTRHDRPDRYAKSLAVAVEVLEANRKELDAVIERLYELERQYDAMLVVLGKVTP